MTEQSRLLRQIPAVDDLLNSQGVSALFELAERSVVSDCIGTVLQRVREFILAGQDIGNWFIEADGEQLIREDALYSAISCKVKEVVSPSLRRVVNATGVIIHTNLGRSALPKAALDAVVKAASGYCNLEYDLVEGKRSKRHEHIASSIAAICGAEDAFVVNNNAAAVLVSLNTLAKGGEVIVSRGELVEIGGSFRMPDVMEASGAVLREVGSTNKTKLSDYESAITDRTTLLLKVHTSNYRIVGFTQDVSVKELVELGAKYNIPVMVDLGSGLLLDENCLPMPDGLVMDEHIARDFIRDGADIVAFSADKLLGSSQAGIVVGKSDMVRAIAKNPLSRAIRIDKLSLAALDATLRLYLAWPTKSYQMIPTLAMLTKSLNEISIEAEEIRSRLASVVSKEFGLGVEPGYSKVGGGTLPLLDLPTVLVAVSPKTISADALSKMLRSAEVPVICRIADDMVLLDPRTILDDDLDALVEAFRNLT
ncbi:MAG: L-seryl-tRNA(Sec) selenium transferase [Candidatus Coatesbacteria bacterium]|nr:L-seryl-tRNA(Sec) selenium transferase [Candidatus Coatesbacteria bacterium]